MKISMAEPDLRGNELKYLKECVDTSWVSSGGRFVTDFEKSFAEFCGTKYASSSSNGTTALHLALLAIGIGEGDEVIVPNLTFASTAASVKFCSATPVLVDVDKETWNIDPNEIVKKITPNSKAIIAVHLYGNPCKMEEIMEIAEEHKLYVIEDAAEALGAVVDGKKVGNIGHIGCFSFFGNKIITTGEGGMCVTNDKDLFAKINMFKNHGKFDLKNKVYEHQVVGYNYRLTNLQAAVGLAQLERFDELLDKRIKVCALYKKLLEGKVTFQKVEENAERVDWLFTVLAENRDEIADRLANEGIESRNVFIPMNELPPYKDSDSYPNSKFVSGKGISLPTHTKLSEEDVQRICEVFLK